MCVLNCAAAAQTDDPYAQPDGEDQYGPKYEATAVPSEIKAELDELGRYVVPSFINLTIERDELECWVIDQNPPGGTVVNGPQTLVVRLMHTCGANEEFWARLPIELKDVTPPDVHVMLDSNVTPHLSFGGVARYVGPAVVVPIFTISDACDANPARETKLDGQLYQMGTAVSSIGLHFLNVSTTDASGNPTNLDMVFEIRERPSRTAAAVVESTNCEIDSNGQSGTMTTTVLVSAPDFDHHDFLLSSVRMMLRASDGTYLNDQPIPIKDAFEAGSNVYQYQTADVDINVCFVRFTFEAALQGNPLTDCPASLIIVGTGVLNGELAYEWGASTANSADTTPVQTLLASVGKYEPCGDPQPPPPPPPPPPCQFVQTLIAVPIDSCLPAFAPGGGVGGANGCSPGDGSRSIAWATPSAMNGNSTSTATAAPNTACASFGPACNVNSGAVLIAQLVGNCCNCAITFSATASVTVSASLTGSGGATQAGSAVGTGKIMVGTPCGGITIDETASPPALNLPPINFTVPGGFSCTVNTCSSAMIITTKAFVSTGASAVGSGTAATCTARSAVDGSVSPTAAGTGSPCPPVGGGDDPGENED